MCLISNAKSNLNFFIILAVSSVYWLVFWLYSSLPLGRWNVLADVNMWQCSRADIQFIFIRTHMPIKLIDQIVDVLGAIHK